MRVIIPTINPDEFGPGYMIRFALANGMNSYKLASEKILEAYPEATKYPGLYPYHLSLLLDLSIEEYVQRHTLLPVHRFIAYKDSHLQHGSLEFESGLKRYAHINYLPDMRVCQACIEEDLDYHGISYFRKSHQLPGLNYCLKHGNGDNGALFATSTTAFCNPHQVKESDLTRLPQFDNEILSRYHVLVDEVNQIKNPINPYVIQKEIMARAMAQGLRSCPGIGKRRISEYLREVLPSEWLKTMLPHSEGKTYENIYSCFDQIIAGARASTKSTNFLILMAVLYSNTDEALTLLFNVNKTPMAPATGGMILESLN